MRTFIALLLWLAPGLLYAQTLPVFEITTPMGFASPMTDTKASSSDSPLRQTLKSVCKSKSYCLEVSGSTVGTAFIYRDSGVLATSLHNLRGFLKIYWENVNRDQLEDIRVPLVLKQNGHVVFGPGDIATVTVTPEARDTIMANRLERRPDLDVAILSLSKDLGEPLQNAEAASPGEEIYIAGYLQGQFDIYTGNDAPPPDGLSTQFDPGTQNLIRFGTYFGAKNLSGSPVLNSLRGVVGMHTGEYKLRYFIPFVAY